ncbi:MAG TPA: flagellar biosynthetic protein FliO [Candidatus Cybelea sp.]|jgi:flagellar biogenesis protein FliO
MPLAFWGTYAVRLAILALVLCAMYAVARCLRDTKLFARHGRRVDVLESAMLSQQAALHLVRVDARYFLIGSAAAGVTPIAELLPPET